ncbi:hypothetical protein Pelo_3096 [Pelomyxa schiedti]|nr:hypothetical protein Pelo_3096 [Pelomyxa schiedti]
MARRNGSTCGTTSLVKKIPVPDTSNLVPISLPPDVNGDVSGEVSVTLGQPRWTDTSLQNRQILVRCKWWGERGPGAIFFSEQQQRPGGGSLKPGTGPIRGPSSVCTVVFPVKCPRHILENYFHDAAALALDIVWAKTLVIAGQAVIPLAGTSGKVFQGAVPVSDPRGRTTGSIQANIALNFFDQGGEEMVLPEERPVRSNPDALFSVDHGNGLPVNNCPIKSESHRENTLDTSVQRKQVTEGGLVPKVTRQITESKPTQPQIPSQEKVHVNDILLRGKALMQKMVAATSETACPPRTRVTPMSIPLQFSPSPSICNTQHKSCTQCACKTRLSCHRSAPKRGRCEC